MCTDHGVDWHEAAVAADELLAFMRVPLTKALDPLDDDDFVKLTAQMARDLEKQHRELTAEDLRRAIDGLDVDWVALTPAAHGAVVRAANLAVRRAEERAIPTYQPILEERSEDMVQSAWRASSTQFDLDVPVDFTGVDWRVVESAGRKDVYFRNEVGDRLQTFSEEGRKIIQNGLEQGLRSRDITEDLQKAARRVYLNRSEHYMRVVASQAANSSRVYGVLRSFVDAQIDTYVFEAVLDERTTEICRMLHGTVFRVEEALNRFVDIADDPDPEAVLDLKPWVRTRRNPETGLQELFIKDRRGIPTKIATVNQPALGKVDEIGRYSDRLSIPTMEQLGISYPPLHGLCRSTVLPG